ncbi:MAG: polyprenyl synthetase family protein [Candidatus Saccharibacteria bacterium]
MKPVLSYGPLLQAELLAFIKAGNLGEKTGIAWGDDFLERLESFATTGKLLRGSILCFSYEVFARQRPGKAVMNAAMALELAHSGLLMHDDVMDNDDMRRGQPAMHRQYQLEAERTGLANSRQFGLSMAISGGDAALFLALELLGESLSSDRETVHYELFVSQLLHTCIGQMQDVYLEALPGLPSKKDIYTLMGVKTAAYTLALPLAMGAALAGAPVPVLRRLEAIGTSAGIIFQIRDDELGIMGDSEKTGKPVGSDIKEGKKTLIYYYLFKKCSQEERRKLAAIFGDPAASASDIVYVQELFRRHETGKYLGAETARLQRKAKARIDRLDIPDESQRTLNELVEFCARRRV